MQKTDFIIKYHPELRTKRKITVEEMLFDLELVIKKNQKGIHASEVVGRDITNEQHKAFLIAWEQVKTEKYEKQNLHFL